MISALGWQSWSPIIPNHWRLPLWDYTPLKETNLSTFSPLSHKLKQPISLWCTWHANGTKISEDLVLSQARKFCTHKYVPQYILIDDGWCTWGDWTSPLPSKFPSGIAGLRPKLSSLNYQTGLWLAPFLADPNSNLVKTHPDWLIKDSLGQPFNGFVSYPLLKSLTPKYLLDFTNPKVITYIYSCLDTMITTWGVTLLKLDHLYAPYFAPSTDQAKLAPQSLQNIFTYLCQKYPQVYTIACGCPFEPAQNLVDSIRLSKDINSPSLNHLPFLGHLLYLKRRNLLKEKLQIAKSISPLPFGLDPDAAINMVDADSYHKL